MNTNNHYGLWKRDGNAFSELLLVVAAITITIPLLSIFFDANQTVSNQGHEGILVRKIADSESGLIPIVNILKPRPHFAKCLSSKWTTDSKSYVATPRESADRWVEKIEELFSIDAMDWDSEKIEKLAEYYKMDPLLMTLPAARKSLLGEQKTLSKASFNRVQSVMQQGTVDTKDAALLNAIPSANIANPEEKLSVSVLSVVNEGEYQSAKDFVSGLIDQVYQEKRVKSEIFEVTTNPAID